MGDLQFFHLGPEGIGIDAELLGCAAGPVYFPPG